jgi:hypothetical protein
MSRALQDIGIRLSVLEKEARDLAALLAQNRPVFARRYARIAEHAAKVQTIIRVHGVFPEDPPQPQTLQATVRALKSDNR